jgi:hypothetical protein
MSKELDAANAVGRIERIGGMAVGEIEKRLKDRPSDFNGATLVRLATEATKIHMAFERRDKPAVGPARNFVQIVTDPGLPPERQKELLVQGIEKLEAAGGDASELRSALENLCGADEAGKRLAIPAEPLPEPDVPHTYVTKGLG